MKDAAPGDIEDFRYARVVAKRNDGSLAVEILDAATPRQS